MKKLLLIIGIILFSEGNPLAQNLILNGNFENYSGCPFDPSQIDSALFWQNPCDFLTGGTSDYLNHCADSTSQVYIPNTDWGFQEAHSGSGYAGLYLFHVYPNYREYMEGTISSPLISGVTYHFQMFVSRGDKSKYSTNDIGIYFSNTLVQGIMGSNALPFSPQINNSTNINDSINWISVDADYIAQGGESFIIIGNFKNDANTVVDTVNPSGISWCYAFIDDISLTPTNPETIFSLHENNNPISISPNPATTEIKITNLSPTENQISIFNLLGQQVKSIRVINIQSTILPVADLPAGIYVVTIFDGEKIVCKKFVRE